MIELNDCLLVSGTLFALGIAGAVLRRNMLVVLMSIELCLNAGNLALVAFARFGEHVQGQVFAFFVMAIAAAEVAVGLAIVVGLYRYRKSIDVEAGRSGELST
jgi:NADH-quinone oxidoreductase subunit K